MVRNTGRVLYLSVLLIFLVSCQAAPTRSLLPATTESETTATPVMITTASTPTSAAGIEKADLLEALRDGGYVVYFRHANTDSATVDMSPVVLSDCTTQRTLSTTGQAQAQEIGQAFQQLQIPVGRVLSSPFCRTLETAQLAFGQAETDPSLENPQTAVDAADRETRTAGLRNLLSELPAPGTNTILISHVSNLIAATKVSIAEGQAAVFQPDGSGGFTLVTTIEWNEWATLEQ